MSVLENESIANKAPVVLFCLGIYLLLIVLRVCLWLFFLGLTCKEAHENKVDDEIEEPPSEGPIQDPVEILQNDSKESLKVQ